MPTFCGEVTETLNQISFYFSLRREIVGMDADLSHQSRFHTDISLLDLLTSDHFQCLTGRETTRDREKQTQQNIVGPKEPCCNISRGKSTAQYFVGM